MKKYPSYSEEFKQSIVNLYRNGKPSGEIFEKYEMSSSVFYKWVRKYSVFDNYGYTRERQSREAMVELAEMILSKYTEDGYEFVTISELMEYDISE